MKKNVTDQDVAPFPGQSDPRVLPEHLQEFWGFMDDSHLDTVAKCQFIEALWAIMLSASTIGVKLEDHCDVFGKTCGKSPPLPEESPDRPPECVDSSLPQGSNKEA